MPSPQSIDAELLAQAALEDTRIRNRAVRIVNLIMDDLEHQLVSAPPAVKLTIQQKILPILTKQLDTDKTNDEMSRIRDEVDTLRDEVAKALLGAHTLEVGE